MAVLGALLLGRTDSDALAFTCLGAFTLGIVLYLIVMTMLFLRWTFQPLEPTEADPPAWIAAGAVAITVLAGSNLLARASGLAAHRAARAVRGGLRRDRVGDGHVLVPAHGRDRRVAPLVRRVPLRYHPSYWALVFPLGMYGAATYRMRAATELGAALGWLPKVAFAVALVPWAAAFAGLLHQLLTTNPPAADSPMTFNTRMGATG